MNDRALRAINFLVLKFRSDPTNRVFRLHIINVASTVASSVVVASTCRFWLLASYSSLLILPNISIGCVNIFSLQ